MLSKSVSQLISELTTAKFPGIVQPWARTPGSSQEVRKVNNHKAR